MSNIPFGIERKMIRKISVETSSIFDVLTFQSVTQNIKFKTRFNFELCSPNHLVSPTANFQYSMLTNPKHYSLINDHLIPSLRGCDVVVWHGRLQLYCWLWVGHHNPAIKWFSYDPWLLHTKLQ